MSSTTVRAEIILALKDSFSAPLKNAGKAGGAAMGDLKKGANDAITSLTGINLASVGVAGAMVGVAAGLKYALGQASEAEQVMAQTEARLKSTGGAAGLTADEVSGLADKLSALNAIDDETVQSAENLLLTFRNVKDGAFQPAMQAAIDLSTAMKMDLNAAVMMTGKALEDPIRGLTALRRAGVSFTAEQQALIKSLVATGNSAEAQKIILEELATQMGGSGAAAANTYAGQLKALNITVDNLAESVGTKLIPMLTEAISTTNLLLTWDQKVTQSLDEHDKAVLMTAASYEEYSKEVMRAAQAAGFFSGSKRVLTEQEFNLQRAIAASTHETSEAARLTALYTDNTQRASQAADAFAGYQRALAGHTYDAKLAVEEAEVATKDYAAELADLHKKASDAAIAQKDLAQSLKDATAADLAAVAIRNLDTALQAGTISEDEHKRATEQLMIAYGLATPSSIAMADATGRLNTLFEEGLINSDQLTAAMGLMPAAAEDGKVSMEELGISLNTYTTPAIKDAKEEARDAADAINAMQSKEITITTNYVNTYSEGAFGTQTGSGQGRAIGGPVSPTESYIVGERGPELFTPATAGTITPNDKLGAGVGGQVFNITIHAPGADAREISQHLAAELRRVQVNGMARLGQTIR